MGVWGWEMEEWMGCLLGMLGDGEMRLESGIRVDSFFLCLLDIPKGCDFFLQLCTVSKQPVCLLLTAGPRRSLGINGETQSACWNCSSVRIARFLRHSPTCLHASSHP